MSDAYKGSQQPASAASEFNLTKFVCEQLINRISTATLVKIETVYDVDELSPVGVVDVKPLVSQLDGEGNPVEHGVIFSVPYFRIQGGTDAIIIDPKQGDIGLASFADRDISKVKVAKDVSLPGSRRRFDMADGVYFGGFLNGTPQQYVQFLTTGIKIVSPQKVTVQAPVCEVIATTSATVKSPVCEVIATTSATVKSPVIHLYDGVATLRKFIMDNFIQFFNNHVHVIGGGTPTVPMDNTYATSNVEGS